MFSCACSGSTSPCQRISNPSIQTECLHPNRSAICAILSLSGGDITIYNMNLTSLGERYPPYLKDGTMSLLPEDFGVHKPYRCTQLFLLHLPYPTPFSWRSQLSIKEEAHFWKLNTILLETRWSYVELNTSLCNNRHRVRQLCLSTSLVHFSTCPPNNRWFAH